MQREIKAQKLLKSHQTACSEFNAKYPIGTKVALRKDFQDEATLTETRSVAWVLPSGEAVIQVKGVSGAYLLSRVIPVKTSTLHLINNNK